MKPSKSIQRAVRVTLAFFFLVIMAGGVVRTTGSGMGCPDWPKCFGYLIPPTDQEPLTLREGKSFEKGQMIIHNDTLWVANDQLKATAEFDHAQWTKYPKHDYAIFDATHTWIEYLNRLATALFAIPILVLIALTAARWRKEGDALSLLMALGVLAMVGFEAWLGKLVVDGNLTTSSITLHMLGSLGIVTLLWGLNFRVGEKRLSNVPHARVKNLTYLLFALVLMQFLLGTQVRERVDVVAATGIERQGWIDALPSIFLIHRSASILLVLTMAALYFYNSKQERRIRTVNTVLGALVAEIIFGAILNYGGFPAYMQPIHLVYAFVLFSSVFYLVLAVTFPRQKSA